MGWYDASQLRGSLNGFVRRNLSRRRALLRALPKPIRIADAWEEAWIIVPDLQRLLGVDGWAVLGELKALSADERRGRARRTPVDDRYLAAWRRLKAVYGFTLRAEIAELLEGSGESPGRKGSRNPAEQQLAAWGLSLLGPCDLAAVRSLGGSGVGAAVSETGGRAQLDRVDVRRLYSALRIAVSYKDSLSWRTCVQLTPGIGAVALIRIEDVADQYRESFVEAMSRLAQPPRTPDHGVARRILDAHAGISAAIDAIHGGEEPSQALSAADFVARLEGAAAKLGIGDDAAQHLAAGIAPAERIDVAGFLAHICASDFGQIV